MQIDANYIIKHAVSTERTREDPRLLVGVARIGNGVCGDILLLDGAQADEAGHQVGAAGLVIGTASTGTAEGLLADNGTSALAVDVEVTSGVAEGLICDLDGGTVLGEHGTGQTVGAGAVNLVTDLGEVGLGGVVVGVDHKNGTEELTGQERVVGVGSTVDSRLDVPALGRVVRSTSEELELGVILSLINDTGKLVEGALVDDGAAEVGELSGFTDVDLLHFSDNLLGEVLGDGRGNVCARSGTALLALELESTTNGLDRGVADIRGLVNQVEVLATGLANNARVATVLAIRHTLGDLAVQHTEDISASSEVKSSELAAVEDGASDLLSITRNKLDNILGQTGLEQDLVHEPVGGNSSGRGLPDDDVTHQGGGTSQVTADGSEVEGADSVHETLERTVLSAVPHAGGVVRRLLGVKFLGVFHTKSEEVNKLSGGVNLGLPGILALSVHGQSHDVVAVLGRNQVGGLEEDAGTLSEGSVGPRLASREGGVNCGLHIGLCGIGVSGHGSMGCGVALGEGFVALEL